MTVPYRADHDAEGGHALLMARWPRAAWHLVLVGDPDGQVRPAPTEEDPLVLHLGVPAGDAPTGRLSGAGGKVVPARNPCWDRWGVVTIADPDGYPLVLSHRRWG